MVYCQVIIRTCVLLPQVTSLHPNAAALLAACLDVLYAQEALEDWSYILDMARSFDDMQTLVDADSPKVLL